MRIFENDRKNIEKFFSNCRSSFWLLLFSYSKGTFRSSFSSSLSWYRWHMRKATAIQRYGNLKVDLLCKYGQNRDFRPWPDIFKKSKITLKPLLCQNYCIVSNNKDQNIHLASLRSKSVDYLNPLASTLWGGLSWDLEKFGGLRGLSRVKLGLRKIWRVKGG